MLSYEEALRIVLRRVKTLPPVTLPLAAAFGKVLAAAAVSRWDLPPADNSAMDGYAFGWAGQSAGAELTLAGFVPAGAPLGNAVAAGEAVKIMTGAPLPAGCDTVVPIEEVEALADRIRLHEAAERGAHVRYRGEEIRRDELLLEAGTALRSGEIGLLAAAGVTEVRVHPAPTVAVLTTGDELVELGAEPGPGQIVNSNLPLLAARLQELGCAVVSLGIAPDSPDALARLIDRGLEADLLLTTGGVSVGDRDLVQEVLLAKGFERGFWKVAIKPGKPVLFGTVAGKPVFGLPGNPAATAATFELFAQPALRLLGGFPDPLPPRLRVTLAEGVKGGVKRQRFLWGALEERGGRYRFQINGSQGSGQNRSLPRSQALLPVPAGEAGLAAGTEVEVLLLRLPPGGTLA
jgi:molybdopterin molybdotransferase